ncbi:MAG: hypothetical protein ACLP3K_12520 [Candidatus Acidiferrales bacterium]
MTSNMNLAVILLLPIIPAYVLFKALKSTGSLAGSWHGLNLQLGGAFAGYFALVLLVLYTHDIWGTPTMYVVQGRVVDENGQPLDLSTVLLTPPLIKTLPDGEFTVYFAPIPGPAENVECPMISVNQKEYETVNIPLDPSRPEMLPKSLKVTRRGSEIDLHDIPMRRMQVGQYAATGTLPQIPASQEPKP